MSILDNIRGIEPKVGVLLCWYYDYENIAYLAATIDEEAWEEVDDLQIHLADMIRVLPAVCRRDFSEIQPWTLHKIWDAIGSSLGLFNSGQEEIDVDLNELYVDISNEITKRSKEKVK